MPATTVTAPQAPAQTPPNQSAAALVVPFTRAAKEHLEQFVDVTQQLDASSHALQPIDVPAYGFMRGIFLQVSASGGASTGTVAVTEDSPFDVLQEVSVVDVNGAPIVGPLSGYDLYLINKWSGVENRGGPSADPKNGEYSAPATGANASGNFSFVLRVPIEISLRDALGSLANQNASSTFKLKLTIAPASSVYSTAPTTLPAIRVQATLDAWTQPNGTDLQGNPNATMPPAHGTTAYWSKTTFNLAAGFSATRLPRVGNWIRELIFIYRDTAGSRANGETNFMDPASIYWDSRLLKSYTKTLWRQSMRRKSGYYTGANDAVAGLDNGVFVEDYCHEFDGRIGAELRDGWLPTVQSTRLELSGSMASAGTLTVITNDVSPAGQVFV